MTLLAKDLKVLRRKLTTPPLNEIADALSKGLKNFKHVAVEVVDCPDLRQEPFNLASEGLCGEASLVDVGGPPYLIPLVDRSKVYDLKDLVEMVGPAGPCLVLGAGAGPWPHVGKNSEMMANVKFSEEGVENLTKIAKLDDEEKEFSLVGLPQSETRFCLLANLLFSKGERGKVLKIVCKERTGGDNFVSSVRLALTNHYPDQPIGLGGVFVLRKGQARLHIMPSFSTEPLHSDEHLNRWLRFYDMSAPLVAVGTLVSQPIQELDVRVEHFHCYSGHGQGGHYHWDVTPEEVHYEAYLSLADQYVRVDQPSQTHLIGRD